MSKKLEEEYRQQLESEVPDLWERIEAGVDAGEAERRKDPEEKKKEKKVAAWRTYSLLAAAGVVVLLCIPAVTGRWFGRNTEKSMEESAMDSAVPLQEQTTNTMMKEEADMEGAAEAVAETPEAQELFEVLKSEGGRAPTEEEQEILREAAIGIAHPEEFYGTWHKTQCQILESGTIHITEASGTETEENRFSLIYNGQPEARGYFISETQAVIESGIHPDNAVVMLLEKKEELLTVTELRGNEDSGTVASAEGNYTLGEPVYVDTQSMLDSGTGGSKSEK